VGRPAEGIILLVFPFLRIAHRQNGQERSKTSGFTPEDGRADVTFRFGDDGGLDKLKEAKSQPIRV
jgi:hypothetical protein